MTIKNKINYRMTAEEKELDDILQIVMPDEYYEDMRVRLIPYLLKWKKKRKPSAKKQLQANCDCIYELINGVFMCRKCGGTAGQWLWSEIQKKQKK